MAKIVRTNKKITGKTGVIFIKVRTRTPEGPRLRLDRFRTLMKITPVFPVIFLFVLTIFAIRSLIDWLKWWGYPFLITGGITSLIALLGAPMLGLIIQVLLQTQAAGFLPPIFFSAMRETISAVTSQILKPVLIEGLVLAILGQGMGIVSMYLARKYSTSRHTVA